MDSCLRASGQTLAPVAGAVAADAVVADAVAAPQRLQAVAREVVTLLEAVVLQPAADAVAAVAPGSTTPCRTSQSDPVASGQAARVRS